MLQGVGKGHVPKLDCPQFIVLQECLQAAAGQGCRPPGVAALRRTFVHHAEEADDAVFFQPKPPALVQNRQPVRLVEKLNEGAVATFSVRAGDLPFQQSGKLPQFAVIRCEKSCHRTLTFSPARRLLRLEMCGLSASSSFTVFPQEEAMLHRVSPALTMR